MGNHSLVGEADYRISFYNITNMEIFEILFGLFDLFETNNKNVAIIILIIFAVILISCGIYFWDDLMKPININ